MRDGTEKSAGAVLSGADVNVTVVSLSVIEIPLEILLL